MKHEHFQLHADAELTHWWFRARRDILRRVVHGVLPPSRDALVVDVGCGTGGNTAAFSTDYECLGIDPSHEAIELARARFPQVRFSCGHATHDLGDDAARAKLFLVADVLEHVPDDMRMLKELVVAARPGAYFLLTVPADPSLWSEHDVSLGHHRRYDPPSLARLWEGLPVETLLFSHFNARLFPLIRAIRAVNRWRGRSSGFGGTDVGRPGTLMNRFLERVFAGEKNRLTRLLADRRTQPYRHGTSLVALLRREPVPSAPLKTPCECVPLSAGHLARSRPAHGTRQVRRSATSGRERMDTLIVVPCYNEAKRLDVEAFKDFGRHAASTRFLFVDDGSTDATRELLELLTESAPDRFAAMALERNCGKAEAVRRGMSAAIEGLCSAGWWAEPEASITVDGDEAPVGNSCYVGYWDADLATPLDAIVGFREILDVRNDVQLVMGSRVRLLGRQIERRATRHYLGRAFATAASCVLGVPVYDTQCGAKLFRLSETLRRILDRPFGSRWIFDVELLARYSQAESRTTLREIVYEYPLTEWRDVAGSQVRWYDFARAGWQLAHISWRYRWPGRGAVEGFAPTGIPPGASFLAVSDDTPCGTSDSGSVEPRVASTESPRDSRSKAERGSVR